MRSSRAKRVSEKPASLSLVWRSLQDMYQARPSVSMSKALTALAVVFGIDGDMAIIWCSDVEMDEWMEERWRSEVEG